MASILIPGERIIDEHSPMSLTHPVARGRGYDGMYRRGFANARFSSMPDSMLIDKSEWRDRIEAKQKDQAQVSDLIRYKKIPPEDQSKTNYCWCTAPTGAFRVVRGIMGQPDKAFSNASVGGPVTGFKNVGGWGDDALERMETHGINEATDWPVNTIDKRLFTPENQKKALENRVADGWWKLEPNNIEQPASLVLQNILVPVGYDFWGHEVYLCDLLWDGEFMFRFRNSWGDIPDYPYGFGVIKGKRMIPSDAVAFRQVTI